jgi:hypothetical protein
VQRIVPFKNELRFLVANGSAIRRMLEHSVENDAPSGGASPAPPLLAHTHTRSLPIDPRCSALSTVWPRQAVAARLQGS